MIPQNMDPHKEMMSTGNTYFLQYSNLFKRELTAETNKNTVVCALLHRSKINENNCTKTERTDGSIPL